MSFVEKLILTLRWITDVERGEMIEAPSYTRTYLGFPQVSQKHLTRICVIVNLILAFEKSAYRITNSMGEIIPYRT